MNRIHRTAAPFAIATLCAFATVSCRSNAPAPREREPASAAPATTPENTPGDAIAADRVPTDPGAPFDGDAAKMARWNTDEIAWFTHEEGVAAAAAANVPMVAVVTADWCPRCTEYSALFADDDVVAAAQDFVMVLVDEAAPEAARDLALDGTYVPRTVFLSPTGEPDPSLNSGRSDYRHFLNPNDPGQLLGLMARAQQ